ncbi:hypothetical protein A3K86_20275 [Photobacterium jeanii]|uniref:HTH luxR-type domain-containing protein n=1 Tax=Photobacterium jeanii TaxID=858640 RepID=A0A178K2X1_9GAMM|nr:helix-turn-helix transcriptional regulator [Photobacterium jeanii]OAN11295.1 hypothetical protein A3K86_20275 [Photobacterium jeanii]PST90815.1 helix-turn-helix transcriptional regulator [Photobacterium jeanii]
MKNLNMDEMIKSLYSALIDPNGFQPFLSKLTTIFNLRSGVILLANLRTHQLKVVWIEGFQDNDIPFFLEKFSHCDPLINELKENPAGTLLHANEETTLQVITDHPEYHQEWLVKKDIHFGLGTVLATDGDWISQLTFQRREDQGDFTNQEKAAIEKLIPHIQHAMQLYHSKVQQDKQRLLSNSLFDQIQLPVILLDEQARVCHTNQGAEQLLGTRFPLQIVNRKLKWLTAKKSSLIEQSIEQVLNTGKAQTLAMNEPSQPIVSLTVTPLVNQFNKPQNHLLEPQQGVAIFIYHEQQRPMLDTEILKSLFRLSNSESKVCCELVYGRSPAEIAERQYLSQETVRTYIKRIMKKTNTNRQNELVAKLVASPAFYPSAPTERFNTAP